ncbi:MAG TPA: mechanosensitive ion channel family protein [Micromonosporaceae bacterium]
MAPSTAATPPACLDNDLCRLIYELTGQDWLAESGYYLLVKPFRIAMIIVMALIIRYVAHRMIERLAQRAGEGTPGLLRPLRDRMPTSLQEATGLRSERRRQRAEALGSVLRSVASVSIFTVAVMLILGELGVNLAPLIASAGIAGLALGFGAQNLVKDFIAGLFMLLEDQYGVGDVVDVGEASGTVEAVGLRITTIRDARGVLWYIRNGEIVRVGNRSQGWALVVVDVPVGFAGVEEATSVLQAAAAALAEDPEYAPDLLEQPEVLGVEQITVEGAVVRTTAKTTSAAQWRVARELRRRLTEAIELAGITAKISANRVFVRPPGPGSTASAGPTDHGVGGAT